MIYLTRVFLHLVFSMLDYFCSCRHSRFPYAPLRYRTVAFHGPTHGTERTSFRHVLTSNVFFSPMPSIFPFLYRGPSVAFAFPNAVRSGWWNGMERNGTRDGMG